MCSCYATTQKSMCTHWVRISLLFQEGRELHHSKFRTCDWPPLPRRPHVTTRDGRAQFRVEPIAAKWLHAKKHERKDKKKDLVSLLATLWKIQEHEHSIKTDHDTHIQKKGKISYPWKRKPINLAPMELNKAAHTHTHTHTVCIICAHVYKDGPSNTSIIIFITFRHKSENQTSIAFPWTHEIKQNTYSPCPNPGCQICKHTKIFCLLLESKCSFWRR